MQWLFELSAACVVIALALSLALKFLTLGSPERRTLPQALVLGLKHPVLALAKARAARKASRS